MRRQKRREPYTVTIDNLSHEGRGVGRVDGKTVFVRGALPGERVLAQRTRSRGRFDEAITLEVIEANPSRITPLCAHAEVCGGCSLLHMASEDQIAHKGSVLFELLEHQGGQQPAARLPPLRGPDWGYRRKARLGVKYVEKKGGALVGFREKSTPYIADIERCIVLDPTVGERLLELRELINGLSIRTRIPQIEVAVGDNAAVLVVRHLEPFVDADVDLLREYQRRSGIGLYLQPAGVESVHPLDESTPALHYFVGDLRLDFLPTDFTQVNGIMNRAMIDLVLEQLDLSDEDSVLDLFCGLGNFSLPLARVSRRVLGVEGSDALVARAGQNARANAIENAEFQCADLADETAVGAIGIENFNKLLLDPPRTGAATVVNGCDLKSIERIVYVSCNPVTLARDTKALLDEHGFKLLNAGVMDMFPHTAHVESIAVFSRP